MSTLSLSEVKARPSEIAEDVDRTHERVHVTRHGREYVVLTRRTASNSRTSCRRVPAARSRMSSPRAPRSLRGSSSPARSSRDPDSSKFRSETRSKDYGGPGVASTGSATASTRRTTASSSSILTTDMMRLCGRASIHVPRRRYPACEPWAGRQHARLPDHAPFASPAMPGPCQPRRIRGEERGWVRCVHAR